LGGTLLQWLLVSSTVAMVLHGGLALGCWASLPRFTRHFFSLFISTCSADSPMAAPSLSRPSHSRRRLSSIFWVARVVV